jgi:hypothetical protein
MTLLISGDRSTVITCSMNASSSVRVSATSRGVQPAGEVVPGGGERELVLVASAPVDGRLGYARAGSHALDREPADADLGEQRARRLEDRLLGARAPA